MRGTAVNYRLYREQAEADHAARAGLNLKSGDDEPNRAARAGLRRERVMRGSATA
jgi:hypothetical protein